MMAPENRDERIRKLFEELRATDRRLTPPFPRVWQRAVASRARPRRIVRLWMPAAAAAAVAVVTLITLFHLVPSRHRAADNLSLAEWRSPTASLLNTPGQELFQGSWEPTRSLVPGGRNGSS
jgi:hypothetical protein